MLTPHPHQLSAHLRLRGLATRAITWPVVPKNAQRIRVCFHSNNSRDEVDKLVIGMVEWAEGWLVTQREAAAEERLNAGQAKL